jgi:hypothetical protein
VRRLVVPLAFVASCGPVAGAPPSNAPVNLCGEDDSACALYQQQPAPRCDVRVHVCQVVVDKEKFDYTLAVTLPDSSTFRGLTYVIKSADFPKNITTNGLRLPLPARVRGRYIVSPDFQKVVGRNLHNTENTTLPTTTSLRLIRDGLDAEALGLPVTTLFASNTDAKPPELQEDKNLGPGGALPLTYSAIVAPGTYERIVAPLAPFDDAYPPIVGMVTVAGGADTSSEVTFPIYGNPDSPGCRGCIPRDPWEPRTSTFRRTGGSLDGFHAWLRDATSHRRVSSIASLSGNSKQVTLNTFGRGNSLDGLQLVLEPDPREGLPTLIDNLLTGALKDTTDYPDLPPRVKVTVRLRTDEGLVPGDVFIASELLTTQDKNAPERAYLHYSVAGEARSGVFTTTLPQGTYTIYATPVGDGRLGQAALPTVSIGDGGATEVEVPFPFLRRVRGRCLLTDGRPVADAEIVAKPSVTLREPNAALPVAAWPRPVTTRTNDSGTFILALDYGDYDIVVKPQATTHLPWVVRANTPVPPPKPDEPDQDLGDVLIPAPVRQSFVLADPNGFAVVSADVRVFRKMKYAPGLVEMGRSLTDASGRVELFLSPYDP